MQVRRGIANLLFPTATARPSRQVLLAAAPDPAACPAEGRRLGSTARSSHQGFPISARTRHEDPRLPAAAPDPRTPGCPRRRLTQAPVRPARAFPSPAVRASLVPPCPVPQRWAAQGPSGSRTHRRGPAAQLGPGPGNARCHKGGHVGAAGRAALSRSRRAASVARHLLPGHPVGPWPWPWPAKEISRPSVIAAFSTYTRRELPSYNPEGAGDRGPASSSSR